MSYFSSKFGDCKGPFTYADNISSKHRDHYQSFTQIPVFFLYEDKEYRDSRFATIGDNGRITVIYMAIDDLKPLIFNTQEEYDMMIMLYPQVAHALENTQGK